MNDELKSKVLKVLEANIRPRSSESKPPYCHWPKIAVELAEEDALKLFLDVHKALKKLTPRYRTRQTDRTSTKGIGVLYFTPQGRRYEIQTVLLPTKKVLLPPNERRGGYVEAYFRGHCYSPINVPTCKPTGEVRFGKPVYRVIELPSVDFSASQIIRAFEESSMSAG